MKARLALFAVLASLLAGCGGSGSNPIQTPTANPYPGTYESTLTLDSGKQGDLTLTVGATGPATGTLVVTAARVPSRDGFTFTAGTITVTGDVDTDGSFRLTGTDPTSGGFDITGSLPTSGNGTGSVTVTAGGQTYTADISIGTGTGSGTLTFGDIQGAPISGAAFPANPYIGISTVAGGSAIVVLPSVTESDRGLMIALSPDATPGTRVTLSSVVNPLATVWYFEGQGDPRPNWLGTGGTLVVEARTGNTFKLRLEGARFTPDPNTSATGSFKIDGTIQK
jgi:hypothetical protein